MPDKPAAWDVAAPPRQTSWQIFPLRRAEEAAADRAALSDLSKAQRVPPRMGDARGLITLNPKLLDIRVVKGWATGSRQLGGARSELGCVSHPTKRSPPVVYKP